MNDDDHGPMEVVPANQGIHGFDCDRLFRDGFDQQVQQEINEADPGARPHRSRQIHSVAAPAGSVLPTFHPAGCPGEQRCCGNTQQINGQ